MKSVETKLNRFYYRSQVFMAVLTGGISLMLLLTVGRRFGLMGLLAAGMVVGIWALIAAREYLRGVKVLDESGVTRRDGRHLPWSDYQKQKRVNMVRQHGQPGPLNHVDLIFATGKARVLPLTLENAGEVLTFLDELDAALQKKSSGPPATAEAPKPLQLPPKVEPASKPLADCTICSQLKDYEHGMQKVGREEEDTFLPAAAGKLVDLMETEPGRNRSPILDRCPECGTYYLYEVVYDYLATGSEDEQKLTRLTPEQAQAYLDRIKA